MIWRGFLPFVPRSHPHESMPIGSKEYFAGIPAGRLPQLRELSVALHGISRACTRGRFGVLRRFVCAGNHLENISASRTRYRVRVGPNKSVGDRDWRDECPEEYSD